MKFLATAFLFLFAFLFLLYPSSTIGIRSFQDPNTHAFTLKNFVKLTGKNAVFHSICDGDLAPALKQALDTFQQACNSIPDPD